MSINKVGVIGAGQMGNGIAHVIALGGYDVVLNDIDTARIDEALATINGNMSRQVSGGKISEADKDAALKRIGRAEKLEDLSDCDLVIEAATENQELKIKIFSALCPNLKPECIIATNTSSISITRLASSTDRPEKFMGFHFMNPVPVMQLVELIRGIATDDETGIQRIERATGRFLRRFTLPETADAEGIAAKSANGILEVTIPKAPEIQARRITVEAA